MNTAKKDGAASALKLRQWLADSDSALSPQAYVLRPDVVLDISRILVSESDPYKRTKIGSIAAVNSLRKAIGVGEVAVNPREVRWLDIMEAQLEELPDTAEACWERMKNELDRSKFIPSEYGLR
jgi:methanol--5-hydroxybenzimidazolylcobamide Co-methyltransferase